MASKAKKPRKMNGYKMASPIPAGFIVKTLQKESWQVGTSIGKGGFGEIYSCSRVGDSTNASKSKKADSYSYAIKIEPQENGPLFVEMHFYMKVAKKEEMEQWMKAKCIKKLGMPSLAGSGTFELGSERYRYIIMDRYGQDVWSLFLQNNKQFPCATALKLGLQIMDMYEYIHDKGYAHCDLKGQNLLLGIKKGTEDQAYLVDYGLATRYTTEYKPDPKKAHNGTIEYTSRDAHQGVITRRGDMEILGYNLLHWTISSLPWENVTDPKVAENQKKTLMDKFAGSGKKLVPTAPQVIIKYLDYVSKLSHDQKPDYDVCRELFKDELKKLGESVAGKLVFRVANIKTPNKKARGRSAARVTHSSDSEEGSKEAEKPPTTRQRSARLARGENINNATLPVVSDENECPPTNTGNKRSKSDKIKGSTWKDCETAKTSGVIKAGEYVSKNPRPIKKQKKV